MVRFNETTTIISVLQLNCRSVADTGAAASSGLSPPHPLYVYLVHHPLYLCPVCHPLYGFLVHHPLYVSQRISGVLHRAARHTESLTLPLLSRLPCPPTFVRFAGLPPFVSSGVLHRAEPRTGSLTLPPPRPRLRWLSSFSSVPLSRQRQSDSS